MTSSVRILAAALCAAALSAPAYAGEKPPEGLPKNMQDIFAVIKDVRTAIQAKDFDAVTKRTTDLKALFAQTSTFWKAHKADQVQAKNDAEVALLDAILAKAAAKDAAGADAAEKTATAGCMTCHDAHRTKSAEGWDVHYTAIDPFVGTWVTNIAKGSYDPPSMKPAQPSTMKRTVEGSGFKHTSVGRNGEGQATSIEYTFVPDGKEYPLKGTSSADVVVVTRVNARTQIQVRKKDGVTVAMYRQTVSPDSQTLTSDEVGFNARGIAYHDTLVFDRQP